MKAPGRQKEKGRQEEAGSCLTLPPAGHTREYRERTWTKSVIMKSFKEVLLLLFSLKYGLLTLTQAGY